MHCWTLSAGQNGVLLGSIFGQRMQALIQHLLPLNMHGAVPQLVFTCLYMFAYASDHYQR
jgi:hypothetical protein